MLFDSKSLEMANLGPLIGKYQIWVAMFRSRHLRFGPTDHCGRKSENFKLRWQKSEHSKIRSRKSGQVKNLSRKSGHESGTSSRAKICGCDRFRPMTDFVTF